MSLLDISDFWICSIFVKVYNLDGLLVLLYPLLRRSL
jgi:hypothetical protein